MRFLIFVDNNQKNSLYRKDFVHNYVQNVDKGMNNP